jgi:hypothetical protein
MRTSGKTIARVELADESGKSRIDAHCVLLVELVVRKIADVRRRLRELRLPVLARNGHAVVAG